ncbi:rod shape-determining protein MreC [Aquicoccus porphyridii]|uniref:Cell shape-determining protein MreC n=1 Tax=Aquicoccus porphyridii TaxID=1852029 RepID=A0A5A9ZTL9_9RHOB|nr:rod shape-determining protein MreC [Aquicoccus porphyridii]KAA0920441.1 rod shape-determining protein MreC [Aquicoccus porphyridii]RAI54772.1 rod shape-determining protein MreC [Rhodobacteraceae bacterium AsT-22]
MMHDRTQTEDFTGPLKRLLAAIVVIALLAVFVLWRIDSPRVERFRAQVVDHVLPNFEWAMVPVTASINLLRDFQSYQALHAQNQELKRELQTMKKWKEAAVQLSQENARLLDLNKVRLDPRLTFITGVVMADSGSPFRQSVVLNIGSRDGILDGWAAMDGLGLVGRISGVGRSTSRVILLTDPSSRVPVTVPSSGQNGLLVGDNTLAPALDFLESPDIARPGDRVVTSGDGEVLPAGLLVGEVAIDPGGRMRVRLAADYERLEFLRVLRHHGQERIVDPGRLILPEALPEALPAPDTPLELGQGDQAPEGGDD